MARLVAFVSMIGEFAQPITDSASGFGRVLISTDHQMSLGVALGLAKEVEAVDQ